jgi:hypothetical protein
VLTLRLTSSGHQLIEALSNEEVWATIKHSFPDASIATLEVVALKLLEDYVQKKIAQGAVFNTAELNTVEFSAPPPVSNDAAALPELPAQGPGPHFELT